MSSTISQKDHARLVVALRLKLLAFAFLVCLGGRPALAQTTATWAGGGGDWSPCPPNGTALWDTCNQNPPVFPNGNFNAVIQGGPVTLGPSDDWSIVNLTINSGDTLTFAGGILHVTGNSIANSGSITMNGSTLFLDGAPVTLGGGGTVSLGASNVVIRGAGALVNQQTIQGQGAMGLGQIPLTNQATITATGGTLTIQPGTGLTNTGTMQASSGSTLTLLSGSPSTPIFDNTGGIIQALNGGTVLLSGGTFTGGTLTTSGTGVMQVESYLSGVTNTGTLTIPESQSATFENTINNVGTIQVQGTLFISGNAILTGKGSLLMSGSSSNIKQLNSTDTLTNQQLIHGAGVIFELPVTNQGTIKADNSSTPLSLQGGTTTNTATLEASGAATLQIENTVNNAGGTIEALNGSTVLLIGTVNGGALKTSGTGTIQSENGTLDGTVNVPTNAGTLDVNGYDLFFQGTINNTGTIALTGNSCIVMNQPSILTGSGTLTMGSSSCIYGSGLAFTNQSTIEGAGTIGDSNPMPITNTGTIIANQPSTLFITPNSTGFTNTGTLIVNAGSTLNITGLLTNLKKGALTGGTYSVSGVLDLQNSIVTNASNIKLTGAAAEIFDNFHSVNALAGLTQNKGTLILQSGQALATTTNVTNSGTISVGTGSSFTAGGSYTQTAKTTTVDGTLSAPTGLALKKGTVQGQGTLVAAVASSGTVIAGDSTNKSGVLTVNGAYTQNSTSVLNVAINGTQLGSQYSQLAVSNGISLNGTLTINRSKKFVPAVGATFTILTGSVITGQFATVKGLSINSNEHFDIAYNSNNVTLTVASGP